MTRFQLLKNILAMNLKKVLDIRTSVWYNNSVLVNLTLAFIPPAPSMLRSRVPVKTRKDRCR